MAVQILLDKSKEGVVLLRYMYRAASIKKTMELILAGINMFWAQLRLHPLQPLHHWPWNYYGHYYIMSFSNVCRFSFSSWGDWQFTNSLSFSLFSTVMWALKMALWFLFHKQCKKMTQTLQYGFSILIGCLHRMTVWSCLFTGLFQRAKIYYF